jgi:Fur family transcriptional regulator, iron response regulator
MSLPTTRNRPYSFALAKLRAAGLRPTRQRLALVKLLFDGDDRHVSAEALHAEAARAGIKLSLATVYNALNQFRDAGLLREVVAEPGCTYFDTNVAEHQHFFWEAERRLVDVPASEVKIAGLPKVPKGMEISRVDVVIRLRQRRP